MIQELLKEYNYLISLIANYDINYSKNKIRLITIIT